MKVGELVLELAAEHPEWGNGRIAAEVRRRVPGAKTSAASVSSTKSRVGSGRRTPETDSRASPFPSGRSGTAQYGSMAVGNAQNWVVRHLLGRLGGHGFTRADWERTRDGAFGGRCAYCGAVDKLEMEHAIPINMERLGEHHLGNLVPACKRCNSDKGDKDYAEFLAGSPERRKVIDGHMARSGYRPLRRDGALVRALLGAARDEVGAVADRFARLLDELDGLIERECPETDVEHCAGAAERREDGSR